MENKFLKNLPLKLISVVIATIVWFSISNVVRPVVNGFVSIPIEMRNEEVIYRQNKTYTVKGDMICKVTYVVKSKDASIVRQSDFRAYVDLNDLLTTEHLPVHVDALNNIDSYVSNIQANPKTLRVTLNDVARVEVPVKYSIKGNLREGHSIGTVALSPEVVYIVGNAENVQKVAYVSVDIPVNDQEDTFSGKAKARIIGVDGKEMPPEGIALSANEINYTVMVYSRANVSVNVHVEGNVKNGYTFAGTQVTPNLIMIDGPKELIQNIYSIDLPTINIDGLSENTEYTFPIQDVLPPGTICNSTNAITVKVMVNDNIINKPTADTENEGPHIIIDKSVIKKYEEEKAKSESEAKLESETKSGG